MCFRYYFQILANSVISWLGLLLCRLRSIFGMKSSEPQKIAVVQLGHLGDLILTQPIILSLKERYAQAKITLVTTKGNKEAVEYFFDKQQVIYYESSRFSRVGKDNKTEFRAGEYDLIIHLRGDWHILIEYFRSLKPVLIVGLSFHSRLRWAFLYSLGLPWFSSGEHQYETWKKVLFPLGLKLPERPVFKLSKTDMDDRDRLLQDLGLSKEKYAVIHATAPWAPRRWPAERFKGLAEYIRDVYGFQAVFIGLEKEGQEIDGMIPAGCFDLIGRLNLRQLLILISASKVFIGNDSGPAHLAAALDRPVLVFFGPQDPELFRPLGNKVTVLRGRRHCSPCWQTICPYSSDRCLLGIGQDEAVVALTELLEDKK